VVLGLLLLDYLPQFRRSFYRLLTNFLGDSITASIERRFPPLLVRER